MADGSYFMAECYALPRNPTVSLDVAAKVPCRGESEAECFTLVAGSGRKQVRRARGAEQLSSGLTGELVLLVVALERGERSCCWKSCCRMSVTSGLQVGALYSEGVDQARSSRRDAGF